MENSKILVILGNGHNLGMTFRTTYADFAKHYLFDAEMYPNSKLYHHLYSSFQNAKNSNLLWSDMENEILRFATSEDWKRCDIQEEREFFEHLRTNLGLYMDGEAKNKLFGGLYNAIDGVKDNCSIMDTLPIVLFRLILLQNKRYDIVSFNYSCLEYILYKIASEILRINNTQPFFHDQIVSFYKERINLNYAHISGTKCVLGTHNDNSIPDAFSFVKKVSQISNEDGYPKNYSQYKSIIIYGHSMGVCDSDFVKGLYKGILNRSKRYNPKLIFVIKGNKENIYDNLTHILQVKQKTIDKHVRISFINVDKSPSKKLLRHSLI